MSDQDMIAEYPEAEQRIATSHSIWRGRRRAQHAGLMKAVSARGSSLGISLAESYAKRAMAEGGEYLKSVFGQDFGSGAKTKKLLAYDGSQSTIEAPIRFTAWKAAENGGLALPKHTLLVFRPVVTTKARDRDGDILETAGARVAPINPLLWQHLSTSPIGRMIAVAEHTESRLKFVSVLLDLNALTEDAAKLIEAEALCISHGFRALDYEELVDEKGRPMDGYRVTEFEVMEHSLVSVPANTEAVIEMYSRGKLTSPEAKAMGKREFDGRQRVFKPGALKVSSGVIQKHLAVDLEHLEASTLEYDWVSRFLGVPVKEVFQVETLIPQHRMGSFMTGYGGLTTEWKTVDVRNITYSGREEPPVYENVQLNSKSSDTFLVHGLRFAKAPEFGVVVKFQPCYAGNYMTVYTSIKDRDHANKLIEDCWEWAKTNNLLKGEAFALTGGFLKRGDVKWEDVFLSPENEKPLKRITKIINQKGKGAAARGVIMAGPPGTGKTLSGKALLTETQASFIWVSSRDFWRAGGAMACLSQTFELAREIAPSIIFLEDVDNWMSDYAIDFLKTEMDGVRAMKGVTTILTTNFPERLPEALIDRPGRFHDYLRLALPDEKVRTAMLRKWMPEDQATDDQVKELVGMTEGYSGAHLWELVQYAGIISEEDEITLVEGAKSALQKINDQRQKIDEAHLSGSRYQGWRNPEVTTVKQHTQSDCDPVAVAPAKNTLVSLDDCVDQHEYDHEYHGQPVAPTTNSPYSSDHPHANPTVIGEQVDEDEEPKDGYDMSGAASAAGGNTTVVDANAANANQGSEKENDKHTVDQVASAINTLATLSSVTEIERAERLLQEAKQRLEDAELERILSE